jgi:hypothetical protein
VVGGVVTGFDGVTTFFAVGVVVVGFETAGAAGVGVGVAAFLALTTWGCGILTAAVPVERVLYCASEVSSLSKGNPYATPAPDIINNNTGVKISFLGNRRDVLLCFLETTGLPAATGVGVGM